MARKMGFRLALAAVVLALAGCGEPPARGEVALPAPTAGEVRPLDCPTFNCERPGVQPGMPYLYRLHTHCGVLSVFFDGRPFYVEAIEPSSVTWGLQNPFNDGTMTLVSHGVAEFRDPQGHVIRFVDDPPGVIGYPYPSQVHVHSGGNRLLEVAFAGRRWQPQGTLPGVTGPPYGDGHDRFTTVEGTMVLLSSDRAAFRSQAGAVVPFTLAPITGCD